MPPGCNPLPPRMDSRLMWAAGGCPRDLPGNHPPAKCTALLCALTCYWTPSHPEGSKGRYRDLDPSQLQTVLKSQPSFEFPGTSAEENRRTVFASQINISLCSHLPSSFSPACRCYYWENCPVYFLQPAAVCFQDSWSTRVGSPPYLGLRSLICNKKGILINSSIV